MIRMEALATSDLNMDGTPEIVVPNWEVEGLRIIHNFITAPPVSSSIIDNTGSKPREIISIKDVLGRDVNPTPNTLLFYIYNDGSVVKTFVVE